MYVCVVYALGVCIEIEGAYIPRCVFKPTSDTQTHANIVHVGCLWRIESTVHNRRAVCGHLLILTEAEARRVHVCDVVH